MSNVLKVELTREEAIFVTAAMADLVATVEGDKDGGPLDTLARGIVDKFDDADKATTKENSNAVQ